MKKNISIVTSLFLFSTINLLANDKSEIELLKEQLQIMQQELKNSNSKMEEMSKELNDLKKVQKKNDFKKLQGQISELKANTGGDNIKFDMDFRSSYNYLNYKLKDGTKLSNKDLLTQKMYINMASQTPIKGLRFFGQLGYYKTWGGNKISSSEPFQNVDWRATSKPDDSIFRIREAYFVYSIPDTPYAFSIGRRPATEGFLANHREGNEKPNSPLAHITNMEVDMGMVRIDLSDTLPFLESPYLKLVYGKAHDNLNMTYSATPYVYSEPSEPLSTDLDPSLRKNKEDDDVRMFVGIFQPYDDGQYKIMAQQALIFNSKGLNPDTSIPKVGGGTTYLGALSLQVNGIGDMINDFLDNTTLFGSVAYSKTDPDSGKLMLGTNEPKTGHSYWVGATFPDLITDSGKFGLEYNYGSKYWSPMTWAEDSVIGSKIATRGSAYEGYWNFPILGAGKYLTGQLRYTYLDYDYAPNTICYWESPTSPKFDVLNSAENLRFFIRYRY